jgi:negative regulator of flagellin synthesis FlgM
MRISGSPYIVDLSRTQAVRQTPPQPAGVQGTQAPAKVRSLDRVEISPQARELQKLKQYLAALPDVWMDRVALAKQNLQYGAYRIDPGAVAQSMMESYDAKNLKGDAA